MVKPSHPSLAVIGQNLRRLRKGVGVSQEQLALDAEIDRTYVSQIERGIANPSILMLKKLSECLKIDLTELIAGA